MIYRGQYTAHVRGSKQKNPNRADWGLEISNGIDETHAEIPGIN